MSKKLIITTIVGVLIIFSYSTVSFLKIRAFRDIPVIAQKYDADGAMKLPETEEEKEKREKALKELAEAIKKQEEGTGNLKYENIQQTDTLKMEQEPFKGEKLDYDVLSAFDNTRYAWWIRLNNEHKPTTIPENILKMIGRYDGLYLGDTSQKKIYLTFDEGYENGYTAQILDTLKKHDVKAAFFITGPYLKEQNDLVKRMLAEGHIVGNHTIHHPSLPSIGVDKLEKELWDLDKEFAQRFGKGFKYMRPPRGEYSERVLAASKQLGYKTVFWSFAYKDFDVNDQKGADYAYNKVINNLHNGAIILLHAVSKDNADALDRIIEDTKQQGYEICLLDF